jgi:hypothetical protein
VGASWSDGEVTETPFREMNVRILPDRDGQSGLYKKSGFQRPLQSMAGMIVRMVCLLLLISAPGISRNMTMRFPFMTPRKACCIRRR